MDSKILFDLVFWELVESSDLIWFDLIWFDLILFDFIIQVHFDATLDPVCFDSQIHFDGRNFVHYTSVSVRIFKKNEKRKRKYSLNRAIAWIGTDNRDLSVRSNKQLNIFPWNHRRRYEMLVNSVSWVIDFVLWGVKIS